MDNPETLETRHKTQTKTQHNTENEKVEQQTAPKNRG